MSTAGRLLLGPGSGYLQDVSVEVLHVRILKLRETQFLAVPFTEPSLGIPLGM